VCLSVSLSLSLSLTHTLLQCALQLIALIAGSLIAAPF
jgi:hypothetical protein